MTLNQYLKIAAGVIVLALVAFGSWDLRGRIDADHTVVVTPDTARGDDYRSLREDLQRERERATRQAGLIGNLLGRIEGLESRLPNSVVVYDTIVRVDSIPVFLAVGTTGDGSSLNVLGATPSDSGHVPFRNTFDLSGCDDFSLSGPGDVTCNKSTLGHLWITPGGGGYLSAGAPPLPVFKLELEWRKSIRGSWSVKGGWDSRRPEEGALWVSRSIKLF